MIKRLSAAIFVLFFTIMILPAFSFADESEYKDYTDIGKLKKPYISIEEVVSSPDKFDRDIIIVDGVISDIQYRRLPNGKKFTLFKIEDTDENEIRVYARGFIKEIDEGSTIRLNGRYSKEKRLFLKEHKHVMKARKINIINSVRVKAF
ncbi:MAG: hypothetical protein ACRENO_07210 [Thermodesulfobacteriota bacterium]